MTSTILDHVLELIQYHEAERGKTPECILIPIAEFHKLEGEIAGTLVVHRSFRSVTYVDICGVTCYASNQTNVTEIVAGMNSELISSYLSLPPKNKKRNAVSECECGSAAVGHPGHSWFCKLYVRNAYDG